MASSGLFVGDKLGCQSFLRSCGCPHYVYVLRRPDGRAFYVGKGGGGRAFGHENEARHPNGRRSNSYKLNVIRSIWRDGSTVRYEIDLITNDEEAAYAREAELIGLYRRLHEGGTLTNLAPGGGSLGGVSPASTARHAATLSGSPTDNPERAILNQFVLGIAAMRSVVIKPAGQFSAKPSQPYPQKSMVPSLRQAVALVASAAANGISLSKACRIPRRVMVDGIDGLVENGVACDIVTSRLGSVIGAQNSSDEIFQLSLDQVRIVIGWVGVPKCVDLGVLPSSALL